MKSIVAGVKAITRALMVAVVILIIAAAFIGYTIGAATQKAPNTTPPEPVRLTEYKTYYDLETNTVVIYTQSSTTYTCYVGTAEINPTSSTISFAPFNATGKLNTTVTTISSVAVVGTITTTITGSYPLTTYTTTANNGSLITTTGCMISS